MDRLGLHRALIQTCQKLHILNLTSIQEKSIPIILQGQNCLVISETGSGKTLCYCLPILQLLSNECYGVYALILLPTKELALQVYEQFRVFSASFAWENEIAWIVGGDKWVTQSQVLSRRPYIVVATPGRLLQHLEMEEVQSGFKHLHTLVLDEADFLLNGTLGIEIQQILEYLPPANERQNLLFTATKTANVMDFIRNVQETFHEASQLNSFKLIDTVSNQKEVLDNLEHFYLFIPSQVKIVYLIHLLFTVLKGQAGIIFSKTCRTAQILTTLLELYELPVTGIHGLLDHKRRSAHLEKFRGNISKLLVATDVAARGLDIPKVNFVVSFDFPKTVESYIHRVGRTARVGRRGVCISIICEKDDTSVVKTIESSIGREIEKFDLPEPDVLARLSDVTRKHQEAKQILSEAGFFDRAMLLRKMKLKKRRAFLKQKKNDLLG